MNVRTFRAPLVCISTVRSTFSIPFCIAALLMLAVTSASAAPITLTFDGNGGTSPVQQSGYQIELSSGGFDANGFNALYIGGAGVQATLTRIDGGPFNFDSIDFISGDGAVNVTFTASNTAQDIVSTSAFTFTHDLPSTFHDITSVVWNQGTAGIDSYAFNNLVVESVPEPGTLGLAILGILGLLGVSFRRRRRA